MSAINKQGKWNIPILLSYLFFLLFGLFLGYKLASEAYDYLKAHQKENAECFKNLKIESSWSFVR